MTQEIERLTPRERDVLAHIASGKCNKEIAVELGLSRATVKGYVALILAKLGVPSRTAAAAVWFEHTAGRPRPYGRGRKAE